MDGLFIIGHQNIILYQDYNESLRDKFIELGKANGLLEENFEERELDSDVVMQLLNPIVTSQRIMCSQFDNRYTRLETMGDLGVHYDELFGFLYLKMGSGDVIKEKKILTACREFSRLICGPDIQLLRMDYEKNNLLRNLMKIWLQLDAEDQATHLERVEYMVVSREMRNQVYAKIQDSLKNLKEEPHFVHYHGFLFSRGKLLTVYSNRGAKDVSPRDLFHIKILGSQVGGSSSCHLIYLTGVQHFCLPHILFSYRISSTLIFQLVIEYDNSDVADVIFNTLTFLCKIHNYPLDADNIKQMIDRSDMAIKQILEALRNNKLAKVEAERMGKSVDMRWSGMKKKFNELAKNSSYREVTKFFEASLPGLIDCLKLLFKTLFFDTFLTLSSNTLLMEASAVLKSHLDGGIVSESALEQQKAAMKAYIDEFPGLIHFVFVDNTDGRTISPERNWDDTRLLSREKFFSTIDLIAKYKKKGRSSVIWKGPELCFSFFTWYEDECGQYLDPKEVSACTENPAASANYYQKITETLFQRTTTVQRIKSYDLYLIHLGLVNSNLCLEHSRRISMTINDIMGSAGNPLDIL